MNAPPVHYVRTTDGYSIAYTVQGDGPPLMVLPFMFSHAQTVWSDSSATPLLLALSQRFRVVYYDARGQGLSQRGLSADTSLESFMADLGAILNLAGPGKPVLLADTAMAHLAVRFAAEHPTKVGALALMHCAVSLTEQLAWCIGLARQNWDYFLGVQAGLAAPREVAEVDRLTARMERLKTRTTKADFVRFCEIFSTSDLSGTLTKINAPTLVIHIPGQGFVGQEESARTAALLPNGRLVVVGGSTFYGEADEVVSAIQDLVAESRSPQMRADAAGASLSQREIQVLKLIAAGKGNQQIADALFISLNTVNRHVSNVYAKMGAANRAEAVTFAHRYGLAD